MLSQQVFYDITGWLVCTGLLLSFVAFIVVGRDNAQRGRHLSSAFAYMCGGWTFMVFGIAVDLVFG